MKTPRNLIQTIIKGLLATTIIISDYIPLVLTAYFALVFTFLSTYNYISGKESDKELAFDADNNQIVRKENNRTGFPALIFAIIVQLLSLAAVFLLTWYVWEKKIKYFN